MKNKIFIFIALACFTLLLIEVPKQYYKVHDQKLLTQQGTSQYDATEANSIDDFSLKIDCFFNYSSALPTNGIGYTNELSVSETSVVLENITEELRILAGKNAESMITNLENPSSEIRCFTAQVFQRIDETQYIWEVGFLELILQDMKTFGRIIYDTDSYKIILSVWEIPFLETEDLHSTYSWDTAIEYYSGISNEIYIEADGDRVVIYPVPIPTEYVETYTLYHDLNDLAQYFWYQTYPEKVIQE